MHLKIGNDCISMMHGDDDGKIENEGGVCVRSGIIHLIFYAISQHSNIKWIFWGENVEWSWNYHGKFDKRFQDIVVEGRRGPFSLWNIPSLEIVMASKTGLLHAQTKIVFCSLSLSEFFWIILLTRVLCNVKGIRAILPHKKFLHPARIHAEQENSRM